MIEVRRDDGELCGYVEPSDGGGWRASTVFGAVLGVHGHESAARQQVESEALVALAERWTLLDGESGEEHVVVIQHAGPGEVTLALGYYSMPGVPTVTIAAADLAGGRWVLRRGADEA